MRRCVSKNASNVHEQLDMLDSAIGNDTRVIVLTREPDQLAATFIDIASKNNVANNIVGTQKLDDILRILHGDSTFRSRYNYSSLFLIGAGAYGHVFRVVSNASGPLADPIYDEEYVRYVQLMRRVKSRKRTGLLDNYRDKLCLDLVGLKIEMLSDDDVHFNSSNKIQLIREFSILTELFRNQTSTNALVGFPMPIEFGFIGRQLLAADISKVNVFDKHGRPSSYVDAFLNPNSILRVTPTDVTNISYITMELVGPNLDEWKQFFGPWHSQKGKIVYSVQTTLKLMDQVLCRLLVMHRKNMVHLDLKPDNVCMGIGKMTNTVYLLDYGLSRICTDERPNITMGSRRYMSVGVLSFYPANYMMDIESWFYVLLVLLTDFVPWSDDVIVSTRMSVNVAKRSSIDQIVQMATQLKKQFWGDEENLDKNLFQQVLDRADALHAKKVPDIKEILTNIYTHICRMRAEFYCVSASRMHADIENEESDLFKRYKTLRKLLLYPYDCDFTLKGSCFAKDKDLYRRQENRRSRYPMLVYAATYGRDWQWDWDVWYDELLRKREANNAGHNADRTSKTAKQSPIEESLTDSSNRERVGMPMWMKHYLARVLGHIDHVTSSSSASSTEFGVRSMDQGVLVA